MRKKVRFDAFTLSNRGCLWEVSDVEGSFAFVVVFGHAKCRDLDQY